MKIKIDNKTIFETFNHYIFEFNSKNFDDCNDIRKIEINKENIDVDCNAVGNTTRKWILDKYENVKGYYFLNEEFKIVGSCWVMFKGGDEKLYKVRKHDAMIFRLNVYEEYQKKGYGKRIMQKIISDLESNEKYSICLACSKKNVPALNLYKKLNGKIVEHHFFIRIFNKNIPYYVI